MMMMWKHKYKHIQCGTQWIASFGGVCERAIGHIQNKKKVMVHNLIVKQYDFGYKSSSFSSLGWCYVAKYARVIFPWIVCARDVHCVYILRKSIDEQINSKQKPNEMKQAGKNVTEPI